jgi:hypothetical protein
MKFSIPSAKPGERDTNPNISSDILNILAGLFWNEFRGRATKVPYTARARKQEDDQCAFDDFSELFEED